MKIHEKIDLPPIAAARAVTDGDTILATTNVQALPERVFRALTTNETERWWGSADTYRQTDWTSDVRVGGQWHVITRTTDGHTLPAGGQFLEVDAPHKVVLTRIYEFDFPALGRRPTKVTYRCEPIPTGTRVTVRHDGFSGLREAADLHAFGWERFLCWLTDYLHSDANTPL